MFRLGGDDDEEEEPEPSIAGRSAVGRGLASLDDGGEQG